MSDIYTQENGSKKKFLAPVLVILLCMVSLTAAGYAYSSTVTNSGDDSDVDFFTLDLYKTNGTLINASFTAEEAGLVVTNATTIGAQKNVVLTVDKISDVIYVFGFKVTAEDTTAFTVSTQEAIFSITNAYDTLDPAPEQTTALAATAKIGGIYTDKECTAEAVSFTSGTMYYVSVVFDAFTAGVYTYSNATQEAGVLADALEGKITVNFGITLGVTNA